MKISSDTFKKKMYRSQILNILHAHGALSQADICKSLRLPKTTVSFIVNNAIKSGLIKRIGTEPAQRNIPGARPVLLNLDDSRSAVLGLAVRDGYFHSGLVNFHGEFSNVKKHKFDKSRWEELPGMIKEAAEEARKSRKNILGAGLAVGGYFLKSNQSLIPENKYFNVPIGMPLIFDDYPNASAKAELLFGRAKGKTTFVFLQLGDLTHRISCYSNGSIVRGTHGLAGEISIAEDLQRESYRSPAWSYQHLKIKHFEDSSPEEIEEHSSHLADIIVQIMLYYDPHQIIISNIPEGIWSTVSRIIDRTVRAYLDLDLYGLQYEIARSTEWKNKEVIYGASLIFEEILMRPRITVRDSAIDININRFSSIRKHKICQTN